MLKKLCWILGCLMAYPAMAGEAEVRNALKANFPDTVIDRVQPASFDSGWYEVVIGGEPFYVDAAGRYLFAGSVIEMSTKRNLTQERKTQLMRVDVKTLPLKNAIKRVYGNGQRVLITFEDPYCSYCKKLANELKTLKNVTIYTFLYPVITPESMALSKRIWCSSDRTQAWLSWMAGKQGKLGSATCKNPIEKNIELGHRNHIRSVPTIIFSDGSMMMGYKKAKDIEAKLSSLSAGKK